MPFTSHGPHVSKTLDKCQDDLLIPEVFAFCICRFRCFGSVAAGVVVCAGGAYSPAKIGAGGNAFHLLRGQFLPAFFRQGNKFLRVFRFRGLLLLLYCAYDINRADWQEIKEKEDAEIAIDRDSLIEPEVQEKVKRLPSGKRTTVVKRIEREVPYEDLLQAKKIRIQNASGAWDFSETGIDEVTLKIVHIIFSEYQKTGNIPDYPAWYV